MFPCFVALVFFQCFSSLRDIVGHRSPAVSQTVWPPSSSSSSFFPFPRRHKSIITFAQKKRVKRGRERWQFGKVRWGRFSDRETVELCLCRMWVFEFVLCRIEVRFPFNSQLEDCILHGKKRYISMTRLARFASNVLLEIKCLPTRRVITSNEAEKGILKAAARRGWLDSFFPIWLRQAGKNNFLSTPAGSRRLFFYRSN